MKGNKLKFMKHEQQQQHIKRESGGKGKALAREVVSHLTHRLPC